MNKFQLKMFINATLEWFLLLFLFIAWLSVQIFNPINTYLTIVKTFDDNTFDGVFVSIIFLTPLISIYLIISKVILPCYRGILKGEIW